MQSSPEDKDWKLKLRYGKLTTPYSHFAVIAEGIVVETVEGFSCPLGTAFISINAWAGDADEAAEMIQDLAPQVGFSISGDIQIFTTEPVHPPEDRPYAYNIRLRPFRD